MKTLALLTTGLVLTWFGFSDPARAATTVITNGTDAELRAAVANCGTVTFDFNGVITLTNDIVVTCAVTIDATGRSVVLSGGNSNRLFQVQSNGNLTLINLALVNGRSTNAGGAIYNEGTVTAQECRFLNNLVLGLAGINGTNGLGGTNNPADSPVGLTPGWPGESGTPGGNTSGGAIFSEGALTLWRCFFSNNSAVAGAGGNGGRGGDGGYAPFPSRRFHGQPGGKGGNGGNGGVAQGGAIASRGILSLDGCTFSNSLARSGSGGAAGGGGYHGLTPQPAPGGRGGTPGSSQGGAVFTGGLTLISNSLMVANSCVAGNSGDGGASFINGSTTNGGVALGGAVYFGGNGLIANSTLFTNVAQGGNAGSSSYLPFPKGGDAIGGGIASTGNILAVNLTLERNTTVGGLFYYISGWCCPVDGTSLGGSIANTGGVFQIVNSILNGGFSNNCFGAITDLGHNLSSDATPVWTSGTSLNNTEPLLLPLGDYGGPTLTMALHAGSPALNNGDCALAPATDQRGVPRPNGPGCDIGAYEGASAPALHIFRNNPAPHLLRWTALASRTYRVEAATSLNAWLPYATNVATTNGPLEVSVPVSTPERFFRLLAE